MSTRFALAIAVGLSAASLFAKTYVVETTHTDTFGGKTVSLTNWWTFVDAKIEGKDGVKLTGVTPELSEADPTMPRVVYDNNKPLPILAIGEGAFANFTLVEKLTMPDSLMRIDDYAFSNCLALAEINLGSALRSIGKRPFVNTSITELELPDTLLSMDGNIAAGLPYGATLKITTSSHFTYSADGQLLFNKDQTRLYACATTAESFVEIPPTVTEIVPDAFFGCFRLKCLNVPASVAKIGSQAFNVSGIWTPETAPESTPNLKTMFFMHDGTNGLAVASDIYAGTPERLTTYVFSEAWTNAYEQAALPAHRWAGRNIEINAGAFATSVFEASYGGIEWKCRIVSEDGASYFVEIYNEDASGQPVAAIPTSTAGSVNSSGSVLSYISVPSSLYGHPVNRIGNAAFKGCNVCSAIVLPTTVSQIGDGAFAGCTALKSIGSDAAADGIVLPDGVEALGYRPFDGLTKVTSLSIPATLTSVSNNPIAGCRFVTSVSVDENNSDFAFSSPLLMNSAATRLIACLPTAAAVEVPATVTVIGPEAFDGCAHLATISFSGNAPEAPAALFDGLPADMIVEANTNETAGWTAALAKAPWKAIADAGRFRNTGNPDSSTTYVDGDGIVWTYRVEGETATIMSVASQDGLPLTVVTLPATIRSYVVKAIGAFAFANQRALTAVSVPSTYESIGDCAFSNCTSLGSVTLASGVRSLGRAPFCGTAIASLALPNTLTSLAGNPLVGCPFVTALTVADGNAAFVAADGLLYDKAKTTLLGCVPNATAVTLPATLDELKGDAFSGCGALASVTFEGDEPEKVGAGVFADVPSTMVVKADAYLHDWGKVVPATWQGRKFVNLGGTYDDGSAVWSYRVEDDTAVITEVASNDSLPLTAVTLPTAIGKYLVKSVDAGAFANQRGLMSVTIPSTYETVCEGAFSNCTSLASVTLEAGVRSLGRAPFYGTALTSLSIPATLTSVSNNPIAGCSFMSSISVDANSANFSFVSPLLMNVAATRLIACLPTAAAVEVPETVTVIGPEAFDSCAHLATISFSGNAPEAPAELFDGLPANTIIEANTNATAGWTAALAKAPWKAIVDAGRFRNTGDADSSTTYVDALGIAWSYRVENEAAIITAVASKEGQPVTSVSMPTVIGKYVVKAIDDFAFANHRALTGISIPSTYEWIGDCAFTNCTSLLTVSFTTGMRSLGRAPFCGTAIASLELPNTLTSLADNPLVGCPFVTALTVASGNAVFAAADGVLYDKAKTTLLACVPSVTSVTLPETLEEIASDAFAGCSQLVKIVAQCDEPKADEGILAATPAGLVTSADAYRLDWGDPTRTTWKGRAFQNVGTTDPVGPQSYKDSSGVVWTYELQGGLAVLGKGSVAIPRTTEGEVTVPATVTVSDELGERAVTVIEADAFVGCAAVTKITIPATVTNIVAGAFNGCEALTAFDVKADNPSYAARNGVLYSKEGSSLVKVPACFRFAATFEERQTTGGASVIEVVEGMSDDPIRMNLTTYVTGKLPTETTTGTVVYEPAVTADELMRGVAHVADFAFADCGFLPEGATVDGTLYTYEDGVLVSTEQGEGLVLPFGTDVTNETISVTNVTETGFYNGKLARWMTCETVADERSVDVEQPDVGTATCGPKAWSGSIWEKQQEPEDDADDESDPSEPELKLADDETLDAIALQNGGTINAYGGLAKSVATGLDSTSVKSVKASGLPSGLKLVKAKDRATGVTSWSIAGTPTKAATKTVTLNVTRKDGTKNTMSFVVAVAAVPAWLPGEFNGVVTAADGTPIGSASAKLTTSGKLSGKLLMPSENGLKGASYAVSMKSFTDYAKATSAYCGTATLKVASASRSVDVSCGATEDGTGLLTLDLGDGLTARLVQNIWKRKDLVAPSYPKNVRVTLDGIAYKFATAGKVKWSGSVKGDDGAAVRVSGSSQLLNDVKTLLLYIPPKRNLTGGRIRLVDLGAAD